MTDRELLELAAKPESVAWLSRDAARLALWKAINSRQFGNPTDDKLILDHLRQQGLWIGKITSPALAEPTVKDSLTVEETLRWENDRLREAWKFLRAEIERLREDNERLREALKKYGQHRSDCAKTLGGYQCTCGFNQQGQSP